MTWTAITTPTRVLIYYNVGTDQQYMIREGALAWRVDVEYSENRAGKGTEKLEYLLTSGQVVRMPWPYRNESDKDRYVAVEMFIGEKWELTK